MNENQSDVSTDAIDLTASEQPGRLTYRPRWAAEPMRASLKVAPVLVLTGARQVGKSTLLANEAPFRDWRRVTLDDPDVLEQAGEAPEALWAGTDAIVIDEAQRAPGLPSAIKRQVDSDRFGVRFVLSGSANLLLMSQVSETLAGRATYHELGPFTLGELAGRSAPALLGELLDGRMPPEATPGGIDPYPHISRGLMPPCVGLSASEATLWWEGYVSTYLERDLRQLSQVESLPDFRRVMEAVAIRSGGLLNQTDISREVGVSQASVHRYLNLLEASHVLRRIPGYTVSRAQRLSKRPKPYLFDSGAAAFLSRLYDAEAIRAARECGGLFEGLVLQHLSALVALLTPKGTVHYWRTTSGAEVDFVVEHGRRLLPIEVKLTARPGYGDVNRLNSFLDAYPSAPCAVLLHAGDEIRLLGERVIAMPWSLLGG